MAEKCLICECDVVSDLCNVGEKGIRGLVNASDLRKDGKAEGFRNQKHGVVHESCRKEYTRADSIKRFLREALSEQQPSTSHGAPRLRSAEVKFDFKTVCFVRKLLTMNFMLNGRKKNPTFAAKGLQCSILQLRQYNYSSCTGEEG